ncbi:MAG TPA: nuclear transport factor 2 family protein [Phenylobacterium sp.]|jgi:ketosteroid isomerase-like protein
MRLTVLAVALGLAMGAGAASAQLAPGAAPVIAVINRMTDAVNHGDAATAFAAFTPAPMIVEDLAPFRWQGPGAPQAWLEGMGANAQAHGITTINMKLSPPTRVDVGADHAYAIVPGRLSYGLKDGHSEHADGLLTFVLLQSGGEWKIDSLIWSGPQATR